MHLIRIGGCALNQTPLDWDGNRDRILAAVEDARRSQFVSITGASKVWRKPTGCERRAVTYTLRRRASLPVTITWPASSSSIGSGGP